MRIRTPDRTFALDRAEEMLALNIDESRRECGAGTGRDWRSGYGHRGRLLSDDPLHPGRIGGEGGAVLALEAELGDRPPIGIDEP